MYTIYCKPRYRCLSYKLQNHSRYEFVQNAPTETPRRISDDCCYRSNETCMKNTSGSRRNRLTFCCLLLVSYCNIRSLKKICYIFDEARLDLYCGAWKRGITPICRCETIFKLPIFITFSAMKATKKLNLNLRFVCS